MQDTRLCERSADVLTKTEFLQNYLSENDYNW